MADTATRLRTLVLSNAAVKTKIGERMYMDKAVIPLPEKGKPYVWYRRVSVTEEDTVDAAAGAAPISELYEVEVISPVEKEVQELTDLIVKSDNSGLALSGYRGTFADTTCKGIFVSEREGGHASKALGAETDQFFNGFNVEVFL